MAVSLVAADLVTGSQWAVALWLAAANVTEVGLGYSLWRALPETYRSARPRVVPLALAGFAVSAAVGAVVALPASSQWFDGALFRSWLDWFSGDTANLATITPMIATAPNLTDRATGRRRSDRRVVALAPAALLCVSLLAVTVGGGPGAMMYPLPALLWCGISCSVFQTTTLAALTGGWLMLQPVHIDPALAGFDGSAAATASLRLGLVLLALGPLMVALDSAHSFRAHSALRRLAETDDLTATLRRRPFMEQATHLLALQGSDEQSALLVIDIDNFKRINDQHGHRVGDRVLVATAAALRRSIRLADLVGRVGGDEFVVFLGGIKVDETTSVITRIQRALAEELGERDVADVGASISIGVTMLAHSTSLGDAFEEADRDMYTAKGGDRNTPGGSHSAMLEQAPA